MAGLYRRGKAETISFACTPLAPDCFAPADDKGAMQMGAVATGFLAIRRHVLVRMAAEMDIRQVVGGPDVQPGDWTSNLFVFFAPHLLADTREELSEDYNFCRRLREMGVEIWADPAIILDHWKLVALHADPMALIVPTQAAG